MFKRNVEKKTNATMAQIACSRANLYGLLVEVFHQLPDEGFLDQIRSGTFEDLFQGFSGVEFIRAYRSRMEGNPPEETLTTLSVDRTRILRGTGSRALKPPYEGCYKERGDLCSAAIEVRRFYRAAGLLPDEAVPESPDYLCVEMDFMRHLCLREQKEWVCDGDAAGTMACESTFLKDHLGSWVGGFCTLAAKHAMTDFYRGFAMVLDTFITMDKAFLKDYK